ncbi:MAG: hypothetical protein A3I61_10735 [Acidobacteria bacterium RIFCSPLOWO2_02_FULL_68_18]|nr:MAG: hypothetical protein A3I61_10735 [Acidobacteria bacterium RIFCSPLOWO2_02_FULL_68_18]OFW48721.1 MAG: hypothetical protein A3G77_14565 [Acidobacteria bacterium RIFCSPLOWO2_12_FULL_68_19]
MTRLVTWFAAVSLALAAGGCAARHAGSYVERGIDFTQYRTYDWAPPDALPAADPRLAKNPYFQDYVQGAIQRGLAGKGFGLAPAASPDLLIHYHASVTQRIAVDPFDRALGACYHETCGVRVREFEAGMLVFDIVDARTGRLVWRGWAQHGVAEILDNPDRMAARVNEAVTGMLETMPGGAQLTVGTPPAERGGAK